MGRLQKKQDKMARRRAVKEAAASAPSRPVDEEDPDIAGIVPGPQPPQQEWLESPGKVAPEEP
jgi:hypothetical protein